MKALFIGGTGIISSGCAPLALEQGFELTLLNRGQSSRPTPEGAEVLVADFRDRAAVEQAIAGREFDVVVDWIAYTPDQVRRDIEMFRGRTGQYIFISSASAYQKPPRSLPITESTPLENPFWQYSRNKIACEDVLTEAYLKTGFPATIVRPSHTYDKTMSPLRGGVTALNRMIQGKPVIVHGDGTSLWVLTHHRDFARGFVGLMANPLAVGEAFHITSDELLTWNRITELMAAAAGVEAKIVHLTSETINRYDPEWGAGLLGDKAHSAIFDNSKIKRFVPGFSAEIPFHRGAREIVNWYLADETRLPAASDPKLDALIDRAIAENQ
ncbi:MAG: SDR family oxidoreductase [Anaerolineales bacterium]